MDADGITATGGAALKKTAVLLLFFAACTLRPADCGPDAFSIPLSHMTNGIRRPFVVREVRGRFTIAQDTEWVAGIGYRFQINGPGGTTHFVRIADDGTFVLEGLAPGRYCFLTSSDGFQGYEGTIIIDPRADESAIIEITVEYGV